MDILPITIAAPRAEQIGTPAADEAKDGWFGTLLQASDERAEFREPETRHAPEPDRSAAKDRPADDRGSAPPPAGDKDTEIPGDLATHPEQPANQSAATAVLESSPARREVVSSRPAAKVPPARSAPEKRAGARQGAQLTAAAPAEKATHDGPQPTATPVAAKAAAPAGNSVAPSPVSAPNPDTVAKPGASATAAAPPPHLRIKPRIENRRQGPGDEPSAKPSGASERSATRRKDPAMAKTATARAKASADGQAPRVAPNLQQSFGAQPGLTAAGPGAGTGGVPAQQPGTAAPTLGLGQSAAHGTPGPAEARPAAPPSAPPGGATEQVALRIRKAAAGGQERISIKLHPAELGRIEVKLAWSDEGLVRAMISADKGETLELLQRDSRALERTLQDAGIKTDSGSLSFDLRGRDGRGEASDDRAPQSADSNAAEGDEAESVEGAPPPAASHRLHRGLLDLSV